MLRKHVQRGAVYSLWRAGRGGFYGMAKPVKTPLIGPPRQP